MRKQYENYLKKENNEYLYKLDKEIENFSI